MTRPNGNTARVVLKYQRKALIPSVYATSATSWTREVGHEGPRDPISTQPGTRSAGVRALPSGYLCEPLSKDRGAWRSVVTAVCFKRP